MTLSEALLKQIEDDENDYADNLCVCVGVELAKQIQAALVAAEQLQRRWHDQSYRLGALFAMDMDLLIKALERKS